MIILFSLIILLTAPWFLYLNFYFKIIALVTLAFVLFSNHNTSQFTAGIEGLQKNLPEGILRGLPLLKGKLRLLRSSSFSKEKSLLKFLTTSFFVISLLIFIISVILTDVKTNVDLERERASNTKFSKLSAVFSNKYIESFRINEGLFFQNLDFGNYFFAGHPRERIGVKETQKLYAITLVFIFLGLVKIKNNLKFFLISLSIFGISISVFLKDPNPNGHFLILPVSAFLSGVGMKSLIKDFGVKGKIILVFCLLIFFMERVLLYA